MPTRRTGRGSHRNRIASGVSNIAWAGVKSATYMATAWWTSLFRRKSAMSWFQPAAPNLTTRPTLDGHVELARRVALSTTSVAVVYAVMLELGLNKTEFREGHPRGVL